MAEYRIETLSSASRELERLEPALGRRIAQAIRDLRANPRPRGSHKLRGREDAYRLRVGDYRVLYRVDDREGSVTIYAVRHRREAYR